MKQRCNNPNHPAFDRYGGAGISYDPRWESYDVFLDDMGPRPSGTTLGRLMDLGDYNRDNCRWMTDSEQGEHRIRRGLHQLCSDNGWA